MFYADWNQCPSELLSRMLVLSYTRQFNINSITALSVNEDTCYSITGPAHLYQFVYYT